MYYSAIHDLDVANGPGIRVTLFVSGCPHHCPNCFNKETWDFYYGKPFTEVAMSDLLEKLSKEQIKGFTLLGGEPFAPANQGACATILETVRAEFPSKDIWCFSGYLFDRDILRMAGRLPHTSRMLSCIDVLIDGPFVQKLKNPSLKFKGSENQRTIDVQESLKQERTVLLPGY